MFDVTFLGAFVAGLLSFLSPCILPMVPFYLSYLAGQGVHVVAETGKVPEGLRRRAITGALFFALGVITVFVGLGATATLFGQLVREWFGVLRWIAAGIIILMGLHFLGVLKIGFLYRQVRADAQNATGLFGAFVIGLAFAFGWTPCVGPVLAAILFTAAGQDTAQHGALLLLTYGAGMTLPFVLAAAFIGPFLRFMARFRRHLGRVEKAMGLLLILFGVLIATGSLNLIAAWMIEHIPWFTSIG
ncbi:cytochrome c biogenesis CcdA family protein [Salipiger sp. PrR002]|uniref:cytochrome c biogenesis CcdA family protein n=1 Tax=Salipiger sp. PrR002 TaxID=2706489 RepID=UPI0013B8AA77|nr:cytochrome c biogenesis protein CcdA [Salipiger sp. PrR002]NDV98032.1 cytochrome c biogenesis protein CcdA [Salipiger sp. PrR002]NDW57007.1 cytochrome c biogenesis protein CcdA [Salipiger sp. PrR004]